MSFNARNKSFIKSKKGCLLTKNKKKKIFNGNYII